MEVAGKTALVTGGAAGIGRAVALRLAREGAAVVVADRDPALGEETVSAIEETGGRAHFAQADLGHDHDVRALMRFTRERLGGADVLVNNAGGAGDTRYPEAPPDEWNRVLDVNLRGLLLATQLAIEAMRGRGGAIVNISSVAGVGTAAHGAPEYAAAKAAVVRLTAALAPLADERIRVNCVCPDWVDTPAVQRSLAAMTPERRAQVPPLVSAEEIAEIVLELVSDDALAGRIVVRFADEPGPRLLPVERKPA
jgi:NAD(P)-dependent dehydrogenase (short-subunit alcohol dehydrogenase family)